MKSIIYLFFIFLLTSPSYAGYQDLFKSPYKKSEPTSQGNAGKNIAQLSESCKRMQSSPLILLSQFYFPKIWPETTPVIPFVGIVTGLIQHESIIFKVCNILIQMDQVGIAGSVLQTGRFLNELTGNQFDSEYKLFDKFHNLANSVYDFEKGNTRKGALENAQNHRKLVELADQSVKYYNEKMNDRGPDAGLEKKHERRAKLQEIARLSYQRAILSESMSCPAPQGDTDFQKKYVNYVPERKANINNSEQEINHYYQQMLNMGVEFNNDQSDMQDYGNRLKQVVFNSVRYKTKRGYYEQENSELTNRVDREGKPIRKMKKVKRAVNTFSVFVDQNLISSFRKKYVDKWEKWVDSQLFTSGTFGLLDGKKGRIEAKFKRYSFECSEVRLSKQIAPNDKSDPNYRNRLNIARQKCMDQLKVRDNTAKNLLDDYINRLTQALTVKYRNQAEIWNFEAIELGYNRVVSSTQKENLDFQETDVACSETLSSNEMKQLKMKANAVNTSLKEAWLKDEVRQTEKLKIVEEANAKARDKMRDQEEKELRKNSSTVKPASPPMSINTNGI